MYPLESSRGGMRRKESIRLDVALTLLASGGDKKDREWGNAGSKGGINKDPSHLTRGGVGGGGGGCLGWGWLFRGGEILFFIQDYQAQLRGNFPESESREAEGDALSRKARSGKGGKRLRTRGGLWKKGRDTFAAPRLSKNDFLRERAGTCREGRRRLRRDLGGYGAPQDW